jgi:hypothetical protein
MDLVDAARGLFARKREARTHDSRRRGGALTSREITELSGVAETVSRILGADGGLVISAILIATSRLDRTRLVTAWATSSRARLRMALAQSFAHAFDAVGRRTAQRQLAQDPHSDVRLAVETAALLRNTPDSEAHEELSKSRGPIRPRPSWLAQQPEATLDELGVREDLSRNVRTLRDMPE